MNTPKGDTLLRNQQRQLLSVWRTHVAPVGNRERRGVGREGERERGDRERERERERVTHDPCAHILVLRPPTSRKILLV